MKREALTDQRDADEYYEHGLHRSQWISFEEKLRAEGERLRGKHGIELAGRANALLTNALLR